MHDLNKLVDEIVSGKRLTIYSQSIESIGYFHAKCEVDICFLHITDCGYWVGKYDMGDITLLTKMVDTEWELLNMLFNRGDWA